MLSGKQIILEGRVVDGRGEAGRFISMDWVIEQCRNTAGFKPFFGTLNVKVSEQDFDFLRRLVSARGKRLVPPVGEDTFCEARMLEINVHGIAAALLYPMVDDYYTDTVEIIAPLKLKPHLGLHEGAFLNFSVTLPDKLPRPEGIIFDLDGTLIDTVDLFYSILCEGFQKVGFPIPRREKVMELMGSGASLREAWQALELNSKGKKRAELIAKCICAFENIWNRRYEKEARLFPGIDILLKRLHSSGIALGVVTSSFYEGKMDLFTRNGLIPDEIFSSIINRNDTVNSKPDPEPVKLCLSRMGLRTNSAIFIGDSPCDLVAGREAGLLTVGVLTGTGTRQYLSSAGADFILDRAVDLVELFD